MVSTLFHSDVDIRFAMLGSRLTEALYWNQLSKGGGFDDSLLVDLLYSH